MPVSSKAFVFIIFVLTFSVFVANLSNLISVDVKDIRTENEVSRKETTGQGNIGLQNQLETEALDIIGDTSEHLIWFLQISDIHISIFHDPTRVTEFREFCDLTLSAINPQVVLASGDLTDAKTADNMGSRQYVEEWRIYKTVLEESKVTNKTVWLDTRGNHDNFNVPSRESKENFYRNFSIQGDINPKSYLYQSRHGGETYSFLAVDACLEPGPRRPFNFVGVVTHSEASNIDQLMEESHRNGGNYTIWFGHYPTSCILAPGEGGIRSIIGRNSNSLVYLCGHFHMLGGAVPNMYTLQRAGFLELELADWKDNRMYRLLAVDHGLFSFRDIRHRTWPVVLVTNPKHALYLMPSREPVHMIAQSTHIRILAFSLSPIALVKVRINGHEWMECLHVKGPLFVSTWNPEVYKAGLHEIHVYVKDESGRETTIVQPFTLDKTRLAFGLLSRITLMCNLSMLFQFLFGSMLFVCVIPLCILKCIHKLVRDRKMKKPRMSGFYYRCWFRKLWILASIDRIFFPLVMYALYLTVGPWSIGEVIEGHTGIIFAWGTFITGQYLPGSFTYLYGFIQMCTFQLPLTVLLATCLENRFKILLKEKRVRHVDRLLRDLPFAAIITMQMMLAYFFWLAYGTMAFLLGPLRTWSAILAACLWYQVVNLPNRCFREALSVWNTPRNNSVLATNREEMLNYIPTPDTPIE